MFKQSCIETLSTKFFYDRISGSFDGGPVSDLQEPKDKVPVAPSTAVGIDLGISDFAITSDGIKHPKPKYLAKALRLPAHLQKNLSRTKKGLQTP